MPLIPTKLLAIAPIVLTAATASASPAQHVVHDAAHTRTAALSHRAPAAAPAATTPMLADDGCPLPGNVGKGGDAHDRCELRRAQAIAEAARK